MLKCLRESTDINWKLCRIDEREGCEKVEGVEANL